MTPLNRKRAICGCLAVCLGAVTLAGCGGGDGGDGGGSGIVTDPDVADPGGSTETAPGTSYSPPAPATTDTGQQEYDESQRSARKTAEGVCSAITTKELAARYGGDPSDPASVAEAYADAVFEPEQSGSAMLGCLDAITARGE